MIEIKLDKIPSLDRKQIWDMLIEHFVELGDLRASFDIQPLYQTAVDLGLDIVAATVNDMTVDQIVKHYQTEQQPVSQEMVEKMFDLNEAFMEHGVQEPTIGYFEPLPKDYATNSVPITYQTIELFKALCFSSHDQSWAWFNDFSISIDDGNGKHIVWFNAFGGILSGFYFGRKEHRMMQILDAIATHFPQLTDTIARQTSNHEKIFFPFYIDDPFVSLNTKPDDVKKKIQTVCLDYFLRFCPRFSVKFLLFNQKSDMNGGLTVQDAIDLLFDLSGVEVDSYRELLSDIDSCTVSKLYNSDIGLDILQLENSVEALHSTVHLEIVLHGTITDNVKRWLYEQLQLSYPRQKVVVIQNEKNHESLETGNTYTLHLGVDRKQQLKQEFESCNLLGFIA